MSYEGMSLPCSIAATNLIAEIDAPRTSFTGDSLARQFMPV